MKILILGSEGSMGRRYQAILESGHHKFWCYDTKNHQRLEDFDEFTHFILATPTHTHFEYLKKLIPMNKIILCEKPITKNIEELYEIDKMLKNSLSKFTMMLQYSELTTPYSAGPSFYDYFKTGNDGLFWDCMQTIHLAEGKVDVDNKSPVWRCKINGRRIGIEYMDLAYIAFVNRWLKGNVVQDFNRIISTHKKCKELQDLYGGN